MRHPTTHSGAPWALMPEALAAALESAAAGRPAPVRRDAHRGERGIAVVPLHGLITAGPDPLADLFGGGTDLGAFTAALRSAVEDPDAAAIVIDADSPGGTVDGVTEAAAAVRAARAAKPVVAIARHLMASAAYWIGSQASEVVATPSAQVGSIGVLGVHEDLSALYERLGVRPTVVSAGRYKAEGLDTGPLSDEALAHRQEVVDDYYALFAADVAAGRGTTAEAVRSGYGEGRALTARRALAAGLVDRVETAEQLVARLSAAMRPAPAGATLAAGGWTLTMTAGPAPEPPFAGPPAPDPRFAFERELYRRR